MLQIHVHMKVDMYTSTVYRHKNVSNLSLLVTYISSLMLLERYN